MKLKLKNIFQKSFDKIKNFRIFRKKLSVIDNKTDNPKNKISLFFDSIVQFIKKIFAFLTKKEKASKKRNFFRHIINFANILLGIILVLFTIIFFILQTDWFKDTLRKEIIKAANEELDATLSIGKIHGTFFTSIIIDDVLLKRYGDTLVYVNKVQLHYNPIQLIFKRIYVREISLFNPKIFLLHDDSLKHWNFDNLAKNPSPEDTSKSSFPLLIIIKNAKIDNLYLKFANYNRRVDNSLQNSFSLDNLIIKNFNFYTNGELYLDTNYFDIKKFTVDFETNLSSLLNISLETSAKIKNNSVSIPNILFKTNNSKIEISAALKNYFLFDSIKAKQYNNFANLDIKLNTKLVGKDLLVFDKTLAYLDLVIKTEINGTLNNINIPKFSLKHKSTILNITGNVKDITDNIKYNIEIDSSKVSLSEIAKDFNIEAIKTFNLNTLKIKAFARGDKHHIYPEISINTDYGNINTKGYLNLRPDSNSYDFLVNVEKFNLEGISDIKSNLNFTTHIKGREFDLSKMNTDINLLLERSTLDKYVFDTTYNKITINKNIIQFVLNNNVNDAEISLTGFVDFNKKQPYYKIDGKLNKINLKKLVSDSLDNTFINLNLSLEGRSFDIDSINADLSLKLNNSFFNRRLVRNLYLDAQIFNPFPKYQTLLLRSNIFDAEFTSRGGFKLAGDLINTQVKELTYIVTKKIKQFNPILLGDTTFVDTTNLFLAKKDRLKDYEISYNIRFKDLNAASKIFSNYRIYTDGELFGVLSSSNEFFNATLNFDFSKIDIRDENTTITYISDLKANYLIKQRYGNADLNNFITRFDLSIKRIFAEQDIKDLKFGFNLENKNLNIYSDVVYDTLVDLSANCNFDFSADTVYKMNFDKLKLNYNKYDWYLNKPISASIYKDRVILEQFWFGREKTRFQTVGEVNDSIIYFSINMPANPISDLIRYFYDGKANFANMDGLINTTFSIDGNIFNPTITLELGIQNLSFNKIKYGNVDFRADYYNGNIEYSLIFLDTTLNFDKPILNVVGNYPIDIELLAGRNPNKVKEKIPIDVKISSKDFNLKALGNIIPMVSEQGGLLNAEIDVFGENLKNLTINGFLKISDAYFKVITNRLTYGLNTDLKFENNIINIDKLEITNKDRISNRGKLKANGMIDFTNLEYNKVELIIDGGLALLNSRFKNSASPVNGDLYFETKDKLKIYLDKYNAKAEGSLVIRNTDVVLLFPEFAYSTEESDDINFVIKTIDEPKQNLTTFTTVSATKNLIKQAKSTQKEFKEKPTQKTNLNMNFDIAVELEDENKMTIVLPPVELDQQIVAFLTGRLVYKFVNGTSFLQGKLSLTENSYLSYIKKFTAEGDIIFESDIANPRLDIIATYTSNYIDTLNNFDDDVAVKIKISGYRKDLGKSFAKSSDNIKVYMGRSNIEKNIADPEKDIIDAGTFIVTGKFKKDLTALDKNTLLNQSNLLANAGTAAVGAAMTAVANNILGDAVKNIDLRQNQRQESRIYISGKVGAFTYTIGSPTQGWQDISKADIKLEYNILRKIYFRVEQKQPLIESTTFQNEIKELGIRFKHEF
ncbi:MAG TPA: hypothetical protein PLP99_08085 [Ignavibacteriales bacterium]|nr:hypothetical protein [Ignavibacteriales bacterium]